MEKKGTFLVGPGAFDCNRGDQALLWLCIDSIRQARPGSTVAVMAEGFDDPDDPQTRQTRQRGLPILPVLLANPRRATSGKDRQIVDTGWSLRKMQLQAIADFFQAVLLLAFPRSRWLARRLMGPERVKTYDYMRSCDALVIKGGGWMYAYPGLRWAYFIWFGLAQLLLAMRRGVDVIILPNSFGPFETRWSRFLARRVLKRCKLVTAREPESLEAMERLLPGKAKLFPDMAFGLESADADWAKAELIRQDVPLGEKPCVGVTMRPWRFPRAKDPTAMYRKYIQAFAALLEHLQAKGFTPILFAHVIGPHAHEDDRIALRDVLEAAGGKAGAVLVDGDYDCRQIKAMYGLMDYMVCTRFHSAIFSIAQNVPCMTMSYQGYKATGIMNEIGLGDLVLPIDAVDAAKIIGMFDKLLAERDRAKEKMAAYMISCHQRLADLQCLINDVLTTSERD